jgi:transglutaminase-like putative cysteine protease
VIYRIVHETEYTYGDPVSTSHHLLHLVPRPYERQIARGGTLEVTPAPAVVSERADYFGNCCTYFELREPHRSLRVTSRREIEIVPAAAPLPDDGGPPWEAVRDQLQRPSSAEELHACELTFESPFVRIPDEAVAYARESFVPGRPILFAVSDLMRRIHDDLVYDAQATVVSTPVAEVLRLGRGVCQDFAHLQIACLRGMGLPARYVSGYLVTTPPPGQPRLVGADASHAWLATYWPGAGWVAFDPTNDVIPDDKHITVAWGRDFGDVTPMRGVIIGGSRHDLRVSVDVAPIAPEESEASSG